MTVSPKKKIFLYKVKKSTNLISNMTLTSFSCSNLNCSAMQFVLSGVMFYNCWNPFALCILAVFDPSFFLTFHRKSSTKHCGFFHSLIINSSELMKIANGKIRAWETLKMSTSTYRGKSALFLGFVRNLGLDRTAKNRGLAFKQKLWI